MNLFSAFAKMTGRAINDKVTERNTKKAKKTAYKNTGKKIKTATKQNKTINGSATYKKELNKEMQTVNKKHQRREKFIDDL